MALTIAGSDPCGGAGIQADLKTFHQQGVYGAAALTLVTVQNTQRVSLVEVLPAELVRDQVQAVLEDLPVAAVKTGALGNAEVVQVLAELAAELQAPLVVDPVMVSKHGAHLVRPEAARAVRDALVPRATLVTPNAMEASWMCGFDVTDVETASEAARAIAQLGCEAVLVKGGHVAGPEAVDVLLVGGELHELSAPRIDTRHTHGTGCTYSAAITAGLARGQTLLEAVAQAKSWLTETLRHAPGLGRGQGPVDHFTPPTRP